MNLMIEILYRLTEGLAAMLVISAVCEVRWKKPAVVLPGTLLLAVGVLALGRIEPEDMIRAMLVQMVLITCVSLLFGKSPVAVRLLAAALVIFLLLGIHFLTQIVLATLLNRNLFYNGMIMLAFNRKTVMYYQLISSLLQIAVVLLLQSRFRKLHRLEARDQWIAAVVIYAVSVVMILLFSGVVLSYNVVMTRVLLIWSFVFMIIAMVLMMSLFLDATLRRKDRLQYKMLATINHTMGESYSQVVARNEELLKLRHDFQSHLTTIRNLQEADIYPYVDTLLQQTTGFSAVSNSGDPYVDAVINSKMPRMEASHIRYTQEIAYPERLTISPADLCSIISNLLDNAIEACEKISNSEDRSISFSIDQTGSMVVITCVNAIVPGSVSSLDLEKTSKQTNRHLHGFGRDNIRSAAERNGGSFMQEVSENEVRSVVLLQEGDADEK